MYKLTGNEIIRIADCASIPADPANRDYREYLEWVQGGGVPIQDIEEPRAKKIAEINSACAAAIVGGFESAALGTAHHYTATLEDQANLSGLVLLGQGDAFTCTDVAGVKAMRLHTISQLKQVLTDGAASKKALLAKARQLKDQVVAAQDIAAIDAVVW